MTERDLSKKAVLNRMTDRRSFTKKIASGAAVAVSGVTLLGSGTERTRAMEKALGDSRGRQLRDAVLPGHSDVDRDDVRVAERNGATVVTAPIETAGGAGDQPMLYGYAETEDGTSFRAMVRIDGFDVNWEAREINTLEVTMYSVTRQGTVDRDRLDLTDRVELDSGSAGVQSPPPCGPCERRECEDVNWSAATEAAIEAGACLYNRDIFSCLMTAHTVATSNFCDKWGDCVTSCGAL